jgi:flagellar M-ring protein FliF
MNAVASLISPLLARFPVLGRLGRVPKPLLLAAAAGIVALIVALAIWSRDPDYKILFSNLQDRDGGAVVTALTQMNVPYRFNESGTALLVPADKVFNTRMQLAAQGLPRGGATGFELLDTPRFGASQFAEQISYQRALEGELARSIEALNPVQSARVHLAIPRQSLFVRERQAPSASVLLHMYPGRTLSEGQVSAIAWLLSSSVPELRAEHVSVVDQTGRLLSSPGGDGRGMDADQTRYIRDIEQRTVERILAILTPLVGPGNVHAQANAEVDFAQREETQEVYRPNQQTGQAAVRSQQTSDSTTAPGSSAQGVPGALSNQAPANAQAPIVNPPLTQGAQPPTEGNQPPAQNAQQTGPNTPPGLRQQPLPTAAAAAAPLGGSGSQRNDNTTNYELDRTISHIKQPVGNVKRMSVAVVVNYAMNDDGDAAALPAETITQLTNLAREAMGYSEARGDSLNLVNSAFNDGVPALPWYENHHWVELGKSALWIIGLALLALWSWSKLIKPTWNRYVHPPLDPVLADMERIEAQRDAQHQARLNAHARYEENVQHAREMALKDPRAVAMVLRAWMNSDER